jgi:hypothetical protein
MPIVDVGLRPPTREPRQALAPHALARRALVVLAGAFALGVLGPTGLAVAQERTALLASPPSADRAPQAGPSASAVAPAVPPPQTAGVPSDKKSSPAERSASARGRSQTIEAASFAVQAELRAARRSRDPGRARCLDQLLTRLHVAARDGRAMRDAIDLAAKRDDAERVEVESVRLAHLADRASRLHAESVGCGGREKVTLDTRARVVVIAPDLPEAELYPASRPAR